MRVFSGAGQEIGKSCVVVTINGKKIMFDCGMHMGCDDHNRYPDFSILSKSGDFDNTISCVIITHLYSFISKPLLKVVSFISMNEIVWVLIVSL